MSASTPASLGYRLAAEWEPQQAVWLSWPHRRATWPDHFEPIPHLFADVARRIAASGQQVCVVATAAALAEAQQILSGVNGVSLIDLPTNDSWLRDSGPVFLSAQPGCGSLPPAAVAFGFNAWGGKYPPWNDDEALGRRIAESLGMRVFSGGMVLEGGAIDTDGEGTLLINRLCVVDERRNPGRSIAEVEQVLRDQLAAKRVIWTGGELAGDDTDGHIDQLARFVAPGRVLAARQPDPLDPNYASLEANLGILRAARDASGRLLEVVPVDLPSRFQRYGVQLPASSLNFLVTNTTVLVPVFSDPADERALQTLEACFPGRSIEPVDCRDLVWGRGAVHCITRDQPRWPQDEV
ncbi:MAG: agmatine deiminase family protein [Pirellulales bacterium]|jgi:agmatine deiminase|nr:agmatine deiminase family protein [Pirellulales bacterium]